MVPDIYVAIRPVIDTFRHLGIPYHIGGSVASSALGVARTTLDVDLVADIQSNHVGAIVDSLLGEYYIDGDMISDAVIRRSSFYLVHLETMIKVDVFIPKEDAYGRESFARKRLDRLAEGGEDEVYIASAEDVILHKLNWYKMGGEISERQWNDLTGVLKVQRDALDTAYLRRWANELGLEALLDRAVIEAGLVE